MKKDAMKKKFEDELVEGQQQKLLKLARRIIPHVTEDDLWQPNDFPDLETNPEFRYEEGVLHGIHVALMAFRSREKEGQ